MCCFGGGRREISPYRFNMSLVVISALLAKRFGSFKIDNRSSGTCETYGEQMTIRLYADSDVPRTWLRCTQ